MLAGNSPALSTTKGTDTPTFSSGHAHAGRKLFRMVGPGARLRHPFYRRRPQRHLRCLDPRRWKLYRWPVAHLGHGHLDYQHHYPDPRPDVAVLGRSRLHARIDHHGHHLADARPMAAQLGSPLTPHLTPHLPVGGGLPPIAVFQSMHRVTDPTPSGASPLPHLALIPHLASMPHLAPIPRFSLHCTFSLPPRLSPHSTLSRPSTSRHHRPLITRSTGVSPTACQFGRYIDSTCGGGTR